MNATRSNPMADERMDETMSYVHQPAAGSGSDPSPAPARGPNGHRYTFGSGSRPLDGYTIKRAIGRGGFGEVYYAVSDAGKEVALKLITRNLEIERRGVLHCMNLKSPHLITVFDLRTNDEADTFVIMEFVSGPSLASILADHPNGMPTPQVRAWMRGLIDGVRYLHEHGIVHRDLKPANLFLEEGVVKIGDYGLSKSIAGSNDAAMSENVGTCHYMAPEISRGKYHKPIDVYAIGVILYEMLTGRVPFDGETAQEVLWRHLTDQPDLSVVAEPYRSILRRALHKDPNQRPSELDELLPREDHATAAPIRFLERQPSAPPLPPSSSAPAEPARPVEDVLVIGDEEPVLYIGPDTVPPRTSTSGRSLPRAAAAGIEAIRARLGSSGGPGNTIPVTPLRFSSVRPTRNPAAHPVVAPLPTLPPLPSPRIRVAELAGSMLGVAPLAGLCAGLALPTYNLLGIDLPADPLQLAFLFAMILLGTWSVLLTTKTWEGRVVSRGSKRLSMLAVGLALGGTVVALARWAQLGPIPQISGSTPVLDALDLQASPDLSAYGFVAFFGLAFALNGFWKLTARDRAGRFRFWPVIKTAAVVMALGLVCPSPQPWGSIVVVLMSILLQLVSPWSREASQVNRAWKARAAVA
jgi:serine/threonine protein kinase